MARGLSWLPRSSHAPTGVKDGGNKGHQDVLDMMGREDIGREDGHKGSLSGFTLGDAPIMNVVAEVISLYPAALI